MEKKEYDELKKKFNLPDFEKLDFDFEISSIEDSNKFILRNVRRKMMEKIDFFTKFMEELLQAEPSLPTLYECKFFTDAEKHKIFGTYETLMRINRESVLLAIDDGEKADAEFIKKVCDEWTVLQKSLKEIASKARDGWVSEPLSKDNTGYLG